MNYEFHPEALREFRESAVFYESQQSGLGARFIAAVQSAVDTLLLRLKLGGYTPCFLLVTHENLPHCAQLIEEVNQECRYTLYIEIR